MLRYLIHDQFILTRLLSDLEPRTEPSPESSLLEEEQRAIRIRTQRLKQQVNDVISVIRRLDDPQLGMDELDRTLSTVRSGQLNP